MKRSLYLDVLKALAIIAVVLFHSGFLTYGYLGVDVFLVIGGYLITKSLYKKILATQTNDDNLSIDSKLNRGGVYLVCYQSFREVASCFASGLYACNGIRLLYNVA